jgi:predicted transcriptional regulator
MAGPDPLCNPHRARIYELILEDPGVHACALKQRSGLAWGTTVYHLQVLTRHGLVASERRGRTVHHFATGDPRVTSRGVLASLRHPTARAIAALVEAEPGLSQKEVCVRLGMSPSLGCWHLARLVASGAVTARRDGRAVRYAPPEAARALLPPVA